MSDKPLGIIELLQRVGEGAVKVQPLASSLLEIKLNKKQGDTEIRFATDQLTPAEVAANKPQNVCLIVWVPKPAMDQAIVDHNADRPIGKAGAA